MANVTHFEKAVTNPIMLWLFAHGWEDPEWGKTTEAQISVGLAIRELAKQVDDHGLAGEIEKLAAKHIANSAGKLAGH